MADTTAKFESSQALFCAIADLAGGQNIDEILNLKKFPTYKHFKLGKYKGIKNTVRIAKADSFTKTTAGLKEIESFLTGNNSWYVSSVLTANYLLKFLHSKVDKDFKDIKESVKIDRFYFRGDKEVMQKIEDCFNVANSNTAYLKKTNQVPFGDVNKWNPADIYYASKSAIKKISDHHKNATDTKRKKSYDFGELNILINGLLDAGQLLPLSLKKVSKSVSLETVNFDVKAKQLLIDGVGKRNKIEGGLWYHDISEYTKWKEPWHVKRENYSPFEPKEKVAAKHKKDTPTRDLRIWVSDNQGRTGEKGNIQIRHEASSNGFKVDFHYKGAGSRGGSLVSHVTFAEMLDLVEPGLGSDFKTAYENGRKAFNMQMKNEYTNPAIPKNYKHKGKGLDRYKEDNRNDWNIKGYDKGKKPTLFPTAAKTGQPSPFSDLRGEVSAIFILNKCFPDLQKWISANGTKVERGSTTSPVDRLIRIIFKYVTTRSESSAKFVIAKN